MASKHFEDNQIIYKRPNGFYTEDYGNYAYDGYFKDGKRHGYGTLIHKCNFIMRCLWNRGNPEGFVVIDYISPDTNIKQYMGEINDDLQYHGQGSLEYINGDYYEGDFENGEFHGYGLLCKTNGTTKYVGKFMNSKYHGQGQMSFHNDAVLIKGVWENGELTHSLTIEL